MDIDTDALGRKALYDLLRGGPGVKPAHASDMAAGRRSPSRELALIIEELTGLPPTFWRAENRGAAMWARIQEEQG